MNKDAEGRYKVGMSNIKLKMWVLDQYLQTETDFGANPEPQIGSRSS